MNEPLPIFAIESHDSWRFIQAANMLDALRIYEEEYGTLPTKEHPHGTIWQEHPTNIYELMTVYNGRLELILSTAKKLVDYPPAAKPINRPCGELARFRRKLQKEERRHHR